jgi:hypothetical protein
LGLWQESADPLGFWGECRRGWGAICKNM